MQVCDTPLLPKVRVKWSAAVPFYSGGPEFKSRSWDYVLADVRIFLIPSSILKGKGQVKTYGGVLAQALVRVGGTNSRAGWFGGGGFLPLQDTNRGF